MLRRLIAILLLLTLCAGPAAAESGAPGFAELTGLDSLQRKLDSGVTITHVYYTEGYGFSVSEFTTWDAGEIDRLWNTLSQIEIVGEVQQSITDWYPQIIFYLSDGTSHSVHFESRWLEVNGRTNYELTNAAAFWQTTAYLVSLHKEDEPAAPEPENRANSLELYLPLELYTGEDDAYWDYWVTDEDVVSIMDSIDDHGPDADTEAVQWVLIEGEQSGSATITLEYVKGGVAWKTLILDVTVDEELNVLVRSMNLLEEKVLKTNDAPFVTAIPITQPPQPVVIVNENTILYYNPNGGKYYHLDANCQSISQQLLPLTSWFTYRQINEEAYQSLLPCYYCDAPFRPED
ncbi:MAG: hypothetical protein IKP40_01900 [Clostridia bacterium]|nr:hypothetical protein [Clostridia bacterium]